MWSKDYWLFQKPVYLVLLGAAGFQGKRACLYNPTAGNYICDKQGAGMEYFKVWNTALPPCKETLTHATVQPPTKWCNFEATRSLIQSFTHSATHSLTHSSPTHPKVETESRVSRPRIRSCSIPTKHSTFSGLKNMMSTIADEVRAKNVVKRLSMLEYQRVSSYTILSFKYVFTPGVKRFPWES